VTIKEGSDLTHEGDTVPAYTVVNPAHTSWEITLNTTYFTKPGDNMSQEAWGQIIIHELLHTLIRIHQPDIAKGNLDHHSMFQNLITPAKQLLMDVFGMDSTLALRLSLSGLGGKWISSAKFDSLSTAVYGVGLTSIDSTFAAYTRGGLGRKCN
jgi:hypothetical protein